VVVDLGPDQYQDCLEVEHLAFGSVIAQFGITAANTPDNPAFWSLEDLAAVVGKGFGLFGVVEPAGGVLGCAFAGPSRNRPGVWELRHLAVRPSAGGAGHGAALVTEAARRARAAGCGVLRIGIVAENQRLSAWYQRLGFRPTQVWQQYPGLPFHVDHLERDVGDPGASQD
jgi:GNAT superfamily N-acetyltransferase